MRDHLGRVLMTNDQDLSVFAHSMDVHQWNLHDQRTSGLILIVVFCVLSTITTGLRIYTRTRIIKAHGRDDWLMVASQLGFWAYCGFQTAELVYGTGWHRYQMTMRNAEQGLKWWLLCATAYAVATSLIKVAIGLFLLRFTTHKLQNFIIWAIIGATGLVGGGYLIFLLLTCMPFSFYWDLDPGHAGYCWSPDVWLDVGYFVAACNTLADAAFAIIPGVIVFRTSMAFRTRLGAYVLLTVGSIAVIATAWRIRYGQSFRQYKGEFLYDTAPIALLSTVEVGLGIIAANFATFRPLFRLWVPRKNKPEDRLPPRPSMYNGTYGNARNIRMLGNFGLADTGASRGARSNFRDWLSSALGNRSSAQPSTYSTTLTGHESINGMPDLVLLKLSNIDVEAGKMPASHIEERLGSDNPESSSSCAASSSSSSASAA